MKKLCFVLAALLLVAAFPSAALASDLYDQYGPMAEWGEEAWNASGNWTDEQWEDYWIGEEHAYEQEYRERTREARQEMGCPDPDGVNVKLNDAFLLFSEEKPFMEQGGVYLPLRAFFTVAGIKADFDYDPQSRGVTVTCEDGSTLFLAADNDVIVVDRPGEEPRERYINFRPLLLNGRMYAEEWELCRFLELDSFFDYSYDILYLVEPESLIEALDSKFSTINRLFNGSIAPDMSQSCKFAGSVALSGILYGEEAGDTVSAAFSYSGLRKGLDMDISFSLQLDLDRMKDSLLSFLDDDTWGIIGALGSGTGRLITNSEEEAMYLQSNLLPLLDDSFSATDWLKLDYPAGELEELLTGLAAPTPAEWFSLGQLIYQSSGGHHYGGQDTYARATETAGIWQALLGDENFSQTSSGGYDVFTLELANKAVPGLSALGFLPGLVDSYGYAYGGGSGGATVSGSLRFKEKEGRAEDMEIKASAKTFGLLPVTYTLDYSGSKTERRGYLEIKGRYLGKLLLSMEYEAAPTTDLPAQAPPQGSGVVDSPGLDSLGGIRLLRN